MPLETSVERELAQKYDNQALFKKSGKVREVFEDGVRSSTILNKPEKVQLNGDLIELEKTRSGMVNRR
jgi:hypothetical protein